MTTRRFGVVFLVVGALLIGAVLLSLDEPNGVAEIVEYADEPVAEFPAVEDSAIREPDLRAEPVRFDVEVLDTIPHDQRAFTQGYELRGGTLYESTGLIGESSLRAVDPVTGEVIRSTLLPAAVFGEGLTFVDDEIIVLTWTDEIGYRIDPDTFDQTGTVAYDGEGWGLCNAGAQLVMSNGSPELTLRSPDTFAELERVEIRFRDAPLERLNELECVDGVVWANVWKTPLIVRIDVASGSVTGVANLETLIPSGYETSNSSVLNGIAHDPDTDTFLVTGKRWPVTYRVRFVEP